VDQAAAHARLVDEAPAGAGWLHEIKYDGYRMHARIDGGKATPSPIAWESWQVPLLAWRKESERSLVRCTD
jgi:hypothetical protein